MTDGDWHKRLGDWSDDDPDTLAWYDAEKQPVVAHVDGQLRLFHSGLLAPVNIDKEELAGCVEDFGDPEVVPLSHHTHRFERDHWTWEL